jgi:S-layer homology domain
MIRLFRLGLVGALAAPVLTLAFISGPAEAAPAPAPPVACSSGVPVPTNSFPGTPVAANNFESGNLSGFAIHTGGNGTATVDNKLAHDGKCSAHLHVTDTAGSLANLVTTMPANTSNVYADGWFNITTVGVSGNDVPYFRFFFDSTRFVDIYRYNSNGQLWLRVTSSTGFNYTKLIPGSVSTSAWHHVSMHVIANGPASTVEIWFDGSPLYSSSKVLTTASTVSAVQVGAEHLRQKGDIYIDDLVIKSASATPTFTDVLTSEAFYKEITWLAATGVSTGWLEANGTRTYRPFEYVTRDAMASFMYKLAGSPAYTPPVVSPFKDVSTSQQFYKEIAWLSSKNISSGWPEADGSRTYRPLQTIDRDAMAAFMYRLAGSPAYTPPVSSPFTDIAAGQQFYAEMAWMSAKNISTGWPGANGSHTYRPLQPIARDAMAAFMYRFNSLYPHV